MLKQIVVNSICTEVAVVYQVYAATAKLQVDTSPVGASGTHHVVMAGGGLSKDAVDKALVSQLPPSEKRLLRTCRLGF